MQFSKFFKKYWFGGVALILLILLVLISPILQNWPLERVDITFTLLGWGLFLLKYLYDKWEGFYIGVNKIGLWILNKDTYWKFNIEFSNDKHSYSTEEFWDSINDYEDSAKLWHRDQQTLIVNMPGYNLRIFLATHRDGEDFVETISIQVSDLILPYRSFRAKIEEQIIPLIYIFNELINPSQEKYGVKISFSSQNPFFGYFVRKLDLPKVVSFSCDLMEDTVGDRDQVVTIRKDSIDIVTDDLHTARALSLKYTAFEKI